MNRKPFFSIIITTYNRAEKLSHALNSIACQSFRNFETIVCDDGSTDHTSEVIDNLRTKIEINYLQNEHSGGPAHPRNAGINVAQGEYIAFLDSDDWWYPDKLKVVSNYLNNADIAYHDLSIFAEDKGKVSKKIIGRHLTKPIFVDLMTNGNPIFTSGAIVKRSLLTKIGGFNEEKSFISVEDFDAWLKISRITDSFIYIPQFLGSYFMSRKNISQPSIIQLDRIKAVYEMHLPFLSPDDRLQANCVFNYILGSINYKTGNINNALLRFKKSIKSKNNKFKFRSLIWIFLIYFKKLCHKN